ncbi:MAG: hypothetical protein FD153_437 [Rhodospirillaceae bacterium]|nr:MAG: hypothetical protein FD153_437 [Rhodospirillaceae bacterium]
MAEAIDTATLLPGADRQVEEDEKPYVSNLFGVHGTPSVSAAQRRRKKQRGTAVPRYRVHKACRHSPCCGEQDRLLGPENRVVLPEWPPYAAGPQRSMSRLRNPVPALPPVGP